MILLKTRLGEVSLTRKRLVRRDRHASFYPLDEQLGVEQGENVTLNLGKLAMACGSFWPYETDGRAGGEGTHRGIVGPLGDPTARRERGRGTGTKGAEEIEAVWEGAVAEGELPTPERLYVQVDGVLVSSTKAGQHHQEGKAALIFTDEVFNTSSVDHWFFMDMPSSLSLMGYAC